jgi:hypothetical protein
LSRRLRATRHFAAATLTPFRLRRHAASQPLIARQLLHYRVDFSSPIFSQRISMMMPPD